MDGTGGSMASPRLPVEEAAAITPLVQDPAPTLR